MTALALDHFSRAEVDVAVIETGLGGRLDATNVLRPCLTITTNIDRDHTEILGTTLRRIAGEKAGIMKSEVPHLIGLLPGVAEEVMRRNCRMQGAPFHRLTSDDFSTDKRRRSLNFHGRELRLSGISPGLPGHHQLENCAVALRAVEILCRDGFKFTRTAVRRGVASVSWPGRFQVIRRAGNPTLILDVCHNASGAKTFAATYREQFPGRKGPVILGLIKRKEHQRIIRSLAGVASDFLLVPMRTRRSVDAAKLLEALDWRGVPVWKFGRLETAYARLLKSCSADDTISIIGSHYLVGEFLQSHAQI